jgi:hypothetical protein
MKDLPVTYDLTAYRGDTWAQTFRLIQDDVPINLTGATVKSWARLPTAKNAIPLQVTVGPEAGKVTISLPPTGMPAGRYNYDLQVAEQDGTVTTWIKGTLRVDQDVTIG